MIIEAEKASSFINKIISNCFEIRSIMLKISVRSREKKCKAFSVFKFCHQWINFAKLVFILFKFCKLYFVVVNVLS